MSNLTIEIYESKLDSIKRNYETALKWRWDNDIYFEKYLKNIIK
jgi:hypothetical protein